VEQLRLLTAWSLASLTFPQILLKVGKDKDA